MRTSRRLGSASPERWLEIAATARLLRASGEENEIREVFRRVLEQEIPFDQIEILHTDASTYPALAWELAREHGIECTFAGGVAATFTHPGQAALAFLDWIADGFEADVLRKSLVSGALTFERAEGRKSDAPGTRAVARALREAQIGWGARRHLAAIDRRIAVLDKPGEPGREADDAGETELAERAARRRPAARRGAGRESFVLRALERARCADASMCDLRAVARGCREFVREFARVADPLDAAALTALEKLLGELEVLPATTLPPQDAAARLSDAVRALSIEADRARPGGPRRGLPRGGFSGRPHTFLLGLDETRHPGADLEDPVLLDAERRQINSLLAPLALPLYRDRPRESARALEKCVGRVAGSLTASYSSWNLRSLDQQSEQFPSPFFLDLHRAASRRPDADYSALLAALPEAAGFIPGIRSRSTRRTGGSRASRRPDPPPPPEPPLCVSWRSTPISPTDGARKTPGNPTTSRSGTDGSPREPRSSIPARAASRSPRRGSKPLPSARSSTSCATCCASSRRRSSSATRPSGSMR